MRGGALLAAVALGVLAGHSASGYALLPPACGRTRAGRAAGGVRIHMHENVPVSPTTQLVALSVGFVGSRYHGYQADPSRPTIEQALRDACRAAGVAPFGRKIKPQHRWTASSRTDARVHAARIIVAAPLCLPADSTGDSLARALNAQLPKDIRVHATCLLPPPLAASEATCGGLDARAHCSHREYSYVIPLSAISAIAPAKHISADEALARAQEVCRLFRGAR